MAQVRSSGAVAIPTRWLGGGAVALVHLLFLLALLLTDKLSIHKAIDVRPMTVYRLPEEPIAQRAPSAAGAPSRITSLPSVAAPHLDGPMILVRPDTPLPPALPGVLDLSIHPGGNKLTIDDLAPPSKEKQLKQFFKDSAEANRLAREPSAGEDCQSQLAKDRDIGGSLGQGYRDPVPMQTVCTPRNSAKDLAKRNDRFAPQ